MTFDLVVAESGTGEHRATILELLREYNGTRAAPAAAKPLAILIRDAQGAVAGGLHAVSAYDWLIVELVFVPEQLRGRGVGASLLARAEEIARARGCIGIWLDTFSFQARGFYERLGYGVFGTVEDHPIGGARYFLKKALG
jgi:GNAT superfamily N-acetyltransferase